MSIVTKVVAILAGLGMLAPIALAKDTLTGGSDSDVSVSVGVQTSRSSTTEVRGDANEESDVDLESGDDNSRGTTTARISDDDNASTTGENEREQHRSQVAAQVQALLWVADRDGGIGKDVRDIASDIASSSERSDEAEAKVEGRSGWLTVLIGADYRNLGALRSEIATTQNAIDRLTAARDRATDASVKAALDVQIQALVESASSTEAYIKAHENVFSVFGWFFKLFS